MAGSPSRSMSTSYSGSYGTSSGADEARSALLSSMEAISCGGARLIASWTVVSRVTGCSRSGESSGHFHRAGSCTWTLATFKAERSSGTNKSCRCVLPGGIEDSSITCERSEIARSIHSSRHGMIMANAARASSFLAGCAMLPDTPCLPALPQKLRSLRYNLHLDVRQSKRRCFELPRLTEE